MKNKFLKYTLILIFSLGYSTLFSQVSFVTTGGNANGTGGSVSYSIGQIAYNTSADIAGFVCQGVQQPYEISTISGLRLTGIDLQFSALPNPATDFIQLRLKGEFLSKLICRMYDYNGHLLFTKPVVENETTFSISKYPMGTYILKVSEDAGLSSQHELKSFKIIKK